MFSQAVCSSTNQYLADIVYSKQFMYPNLKCMIKSAILILYMNIMLKHRWRKWFLKILPRPRNGPISGGNFFRFFIQFLLYGLDTWGGGNIGVRQITIRPVGRTANYVAIQSPSNFDFHPLFELILAIFTKILQKVKLWNFVLIILTKNFLQDIKRYLKKQKQF